MPKTARKPKEPASISIAEAKVNLTSLIRRAESGPVLLTRHGKPAAAIIGFGDEDDYFDWRLENDPRFRTAIETSIQQAADGKLTSLRDLRKELAL